MQVHVCWHGYVSCYLPCLVDPPTTCPAVQWRQFLAASAALGHVTVKGSAVEVPSAPASGLPSAAGSTVDTGSGSVGAPSGGLGAGSGLTSPRKAPMSTGSPEFVHLLRSRVSSATLEFTVGLDGSMTLLRCRCGPHPRMIVQHTVCAHCVFR